MRPSPVSMACQRPRTSRRPSSSALDSSAGRSVTWSTSWSRSTENRAVTLTTEGLGSRSSGSVTFPGSRLSRVFDVIAATITVLIRDRLKRSEEIMTAGLRYPGDEPTGTPKSIHQTSPRATTPSRRSRSWNEPPTMIRGPSVPWRVRLPVRSVGPGRGPSRCLGGTWSELVRRVGSGSRQAAGPPARHTRKGRPARTRLSSRT